MSVGFIRSTSSRVGALALALGLVGFLGCSGGSGGTLVRTDDGFRITEPSGSGLGDRARFREAAASLAEDDLDSAIPAFESAAEALPGHAGPRVNLAIALRRADRIEEAEQALLAAIELHPRHVVAHNELGIVYRRLGRLEEARDSYERALALHDDFHFAHRNLGILCDLFLEDLGCALAHYRRYLEIVPDDAQVAVWVADLEQRAAQ
ncbi:MAG: tetratricopeptide repeat protein [Myxococcota bacterium]